MDGTLPMADGRLVVIGAGPAGLTTACEFAKLSPSSAITVFDADEIVGGISRTEEFDGFRLDIGGHRFFTKVAEVEAFWREMLGAEFIRRNRVSRIYYRGKFYNYPLKIFNALGNLGPYEAARIVASYMKWQLRPRPVEESFEDWVINRFGGRLYAHFFRSYTQKVWGMNPRNIRADWAAQRIKSMTLSDVIKKGLTGKNDAVSLIDAFEYPRLGPGQMWEAAAAHLEELGHAVHLRHYVSRLEREGARITAIHVEGPEGPMRVEGDEFVNSMPLRELVHAIDPPPPAEVLEAADKLRYRDFLIVALVLNEPDPFEDNWVYVHADEVRVGRIQNFRAWSRDMVPNDRQASIGMEYFCNENDDLWRMSDEALIETAAQELETLGLGRAAMVEKGYVIRQKKAYPVYDGDYMEALEVISGWLSGLDNLQTVGRNGLHRYNNQDHSMLSGMYAARNILGAEHDLWNVNVERSYHEEMEVAVKETTRA